MLSNAYFLAKFRFDTAENEPAKSSQNFCDGSELVLREAAPDVGSTGSSKGSGSERVAAMRPALVLAVASVAAIPRQSQMPMTGGGYRAGLFRQALESWFSALSKLHFASKFVFSL